MKISKTKLEYLFYTYEIKKIDCYNNPNGNIIYYFMEGFLNLKYKKIPRFIVEDKDGNAYYVYIIFNKAICFNNKFKNEVTYIQDNLENFIKSWNNDYLYGTSLHFILEDKTSYEDLMKNAITVHEDCDIYPEEYPEIRNPIILHHHSFEIMLPNSTLIKVSIKNENIKYNPIYKNKIQSEINFIKKYIDIFKIVQERDWYLSLRDIIDDLKSGKTLDECIKDLWWPGN